VVGNPTIVLRPASFIDLSADQERCAIGALAELLVPLLADPVVAPHVAPIGDT